ncbi:winged helix-turn-helix domain-containing protein [Demequina capsici]|uniref:Winged helix-turn-helix domain-containing protein n=1 Tax=Demequina capsici TaxID=3075620 RepID=A0AA96FES2_9MICO|nr:MULTISPECIES: winged helix-turn-helix domain-containing protein [unclassified Demequina]WNM25762.1 winged helix-turn-helix domain-containing protein [Demequina sp. OYTSA14]WNM28658.1 winged helix-turn-helix domain-containing protein [Demequina sp. PMTSA13]
MTDDNGIPLPSWPTRDITDPRELRALAHPVRFALLDLLAEGPKTATECAELLGETPANCSYHLRQLAKYGHVIEAGGGKGRERRWSMRKEGIRWSSVEAQDAATAALGTVLGNVVDEHRFSKWRAYSAVNASDDPAWRAASTSMDVAVWMTPDELNAVAQQVLDLFTPYVERDRREEPPAEGSRLVRFFGYGWGAPR